MECIECRKNIKSTDRLNYEYMYDEEDDLWCMACAEMESDTGDVY